MNTDQVLEGVLAACLKDGTCALCKKPATIDDEPGEVIENHAEDCEVSFAILEMIA